MAKKEREGIDSLMKLALVPQPAEKDKIWIKVANAPLVRHLPTGYYYVRKRKKGKNPLFKSTGFKTVGAAKTKADDMIDEWKGIKPAPLSAKLVSDICDEFLPILEAEHENGKRKPRTAEHDRHYLPRIKELLGSYSIREIDEAFWELWLRGRSTEGLGNFTKYVSKLLTYAYRKKYIDRKPELRNPQKSSKTGMIYENSDIETFIRYADPTLRDLIIIGAECGLRPDENRGMKWEWITFLTDRVIISIPAEAEKRGQSRSINASPNASECLRNRFRNRVGPYVFPSPRNANKPITRKHGAALWLRMLSNVKKAAFSFKAGIKFHWLRHSFFSKALLDAKLPLAQVAQYGGNSPNVLMKRYLQDDPERTIDVSKVVNLDLSGGKRVKNKR